MQRKIIVLLLLLSLGRNTIAQTKKKAIVKRATKEYFDINKYKDWETDSTYTLYENKKFLKKGTDRIRIILFDETMQVEKTSVLHPYKNIQFIIQQQKRYLVLGFIFMDFQF